MIRKAVIRDSDGFVSNVIVLPDGWMGAVTDEWQAPTGFTAIDARDAGPGDTWNGTVFVKPPAPPVIVPPVDPTIALDAAINGAGTLAALKAVLVGKVGARPGQGD